MNSRTSADAPPPPLHIDATPYFPFFALNTLYQNRIQPHFFDSILISKFNTIVVLHMLLGLTPNNVTKIRAPLHPNGCPNETAPPCAFNRFCLCIHIIRDTETNITVLVFMTYRI